MTFDLTVVVPVYNNVRGLWECCRALDRCHQEPGGTRVEVVAVDDGSTEDLSVVAREHAQVRIVQLAHGGPVAARNRGWQEARGRIVAFVDSDVTVTDGWLTSILAPFEDPDVVAVEGRVEDSCAPHYFRHRAENRGGRYYLTANMAYRRDVLVAVGGFDENFYWGGIYFREDTDLAFRVMKFGRLVYADAALAIHHGRPIGFWEKVWETRRYFMDPLLIVKHGRRAAWADFIRNGPLRIPIPRQLSAWTLWMLGAWLVIAPSHGIWIGAVWVLLFVMRSWISLRREVAPRVEAVRAILSELLQCALMSLAHIAGWIYVARLVFAGTIGRKGADVGAVEMFEA